MVPSSTVVGQGNKGRRGAIKRFGLVWLSLLSSAKPVTCGCLPKFLARLECARVASALP